MRITLLAAFMKLRLSRMDRIRQYPEEVQQLWFQGLLNTARDTRIGQQYRFSEIRTPEELAQRLPPQTYEEYFPWIETILKGEASVTWPGQVRWFAKSSGTTNDKSKFIPVTRESLHDNHFRAGKDLFAQYFANNPHSRMADGYNLVIGGSHEVNRLNQWSRYGDLSAVILENLPFFYSLFRTPPKEISLMGEWEKKLEAMAEVVIRQDIRAMTGVPTWLLVLFDRLFEMKGLKEKNLLAIWPNLEVFFHGAVAFGPYRELFHRLIPTPNMHYMETYNASEGFFAFQDQPGSEDLLLLLDHGIWYEFIPVVGGTLQTERTCRLDSVVLNQTYALVITTNGGLWRYQIGDTIRFTSLKPYRIRISGRTKQFINAFGEELMVENAEMALQEACKRTGALVQDYTAAPRYVEGNQKGGHEWIIEFAHPPKSPDEFARIMDTELQRVNSDYAAKRYQDMAMQFPVIHTAPSGTFYEWMKSRGKLGGQNKVPRLSNTREYLDPLLERL